MMLVHRIKGAFLAFKDPRLVGEARGMRETLEHIATQDGCALLTADFICGGIVPKISVLTYEQGSCIRDYVGI